MEEGCKSFLLILMAMGLKLVITLPMTPELLIQGLFSPPMLISSYCEPPFVYAVGYGLRVIIYNEGNLCGCAVIFVLYIICLPTTRFTYPLKPY